MKQLIVIFSIWAVFLTLAFCAPKVVKEEPKTEIKPMTIELGQRVFDCDSALNARDMKVAELRDSIIKIKVSSDSLKTKLFLSNYKIEKVRFYLSICKRKPTNDKFLKGWISRAIK